MDKSLNEYFNALKAENQRLNEELLQKEKKISGVLRSDYSGSFTVKLNESQIALIKWLADNMEFDIVFETSDTFEEI